MESAHSPRSFLSARGNRRTLRALGLVCLLFPTACAAQSWTLAWSDEFDGAAGSPINSSNWQYDTGILKVNNEVEYYCAPASSTPPCVSAAPNAYIDGNGHLIIQAIKINSSVTPSSGSWTSARLNTGKNLRNFQFGRLESSISLPVGAGLWPAFWALGNNIGGVGWPSSGEMDFMENVPVSGGLGPNAFRSTIHGGNSSSSCYCGENGLGQSYTFPIINHHSGPGVTAFHSYGAIWSTNMVQFYVDDPSNVFLVRTVNDLPAGFTWDFNRPFFLLLNLAVGGTGSWPGPADGNTPNPAIMTVDYVRWYKPSAVAGPTMSAAPISLKSGGAGSATVNLNSTNGTGRVYLSCTTTAPQATCAITSGDVLSTYTVDFSKTGRGLATVKLTTVADTPGLPEGGSGKRTSPGNYAVTVSSYTVSNTSGSPDSVLSIPLTVH